MKKLARDATLLYLAGLLGLWIALTFGGDRWWPATVVLFAPRWVVALPAIVLLPATLFCAPKWTLTYLLHAAVIVGPIMRYNIPAALLSASNNETGTALAISPVGLGEQEQLRLTSGTLRVLTCNLGGGEPRLGELKSLIQDGDVDIVFLQECEARHSEKLFGELDWNCRRSGLMSIGSRHELSPLETLAMHEPNRHHASAIACEIRFLPEDIDGATAEISGETEKQPSAAAAPMLLVNLHLPTPRHGLQEIIDEGFDGVCLLDRITDYRRDMSLNIAEHVSAYPGAKIVAGDFNMPTDSQIYKEAWGKYHNAFSSTGTGFGYTKRTRWHGIRIDHVLCSQELAPTGCEIYPSVGGDHRPQIASVRASQ